MVINLNTEQTNTYNRELFPVISIADNIQNNMYAEVQYKNAIDKSINNLEKNLSALAETTSIPPDIFNDVNSLKQNNIFINKTDESIALYTKELYDSYVNFIKGSVAGTNVLSGGGKKNIIFTNISNKSYNWKLDDNGNYIYIEKQNNKLIRKIIKYKKTKIIEITTYLPNKKVIKINSKGKLFF